MEVLSLLRQKGFTISIDDFGISYSALSRLKALPIDTLKIGRSVIGHADSDLDCQAVVSVVLSLGRVFGLNVVATGVECEQQMRVLSDEGCRRIQGFYFSQPLPATDIPVFLARSPACDAS